MIHSITGLLVTRVGLRQFNEAFAERDPTFWTIGPQCDWQVRQWLVLSVAYLFERGLADGQSQVQFRDDVSYRQHFVSAGISFWITPSLSTTIGYVYRRKSFTSELVGDSNRGVTDTTHQGSLEVRYELSPAAAVTLGVQRSQRSSTLPTRDFFNTNTMLVAQYLF
ncbi:MAG: hypothetical protein LV473_17610 [Nitrospira sp.]|nr:hypothetical protein [Nitrospira sp.]